MPQETGKRVFGVILVYNCARLLPDAFKKFPLHLFDTVIIADDGSTDNTYEVAKNLGVPAFTNPHRGYGGNLKFALKKVVEMGADFVVELHGDGQFDSSAVPSAITKLKSGCDFVLGNRFTDLLQPLKDGMGLIRYCGNLTLSFMARVVLQIPHRDLFTGLRAYSKHLVESVDLTAGSDDYFFSFEIIAQARYVGLSFCFVPTRANYHGEHTSMSLWKGVIEIFQTTHTLILYLLAQFGIKIGIFSSLHKPVSIRESE
ncbi:MAG: glycosyltransferase family 2 protein [bacterium]|nr:glycosyltransferase family 2 protein [bacterium]